MVTDIGGVGEAEEKENSFWRLCIEKRRMAELELEVVGAGDAAWRRASSCMAAVYIEGGWWDIGLPMLNMDDVGEATDSLGDAAAWSSNEDVDD